MSERPPAILPHPYVLWGLVLVGVAAVSLASILIRLAEAPALAIAAYRVSLAALLIGPVFAHRHGRTPSPWGSKVLAFTLLSGIFLALHFVFWIQSLRMTSVSSSVTLVSTTPLWVALISLVWLKERLHGRLVLGILLTMSGSALVAGTDFSLSPEALRGDLLALLGALMASGYLLAGRLVRRSLDLPAYTFIAYGTAALVLLTACALTQTPLAGFSRETYLLLLLLALIPQLIGHTTFNWTLKFLSPTTVAVLILGEPVGATLLACVFLGETVSQPKALGLVVLAAGILLSALPAPSKSHQIETRSMVEVDTQGEKQ